MRMAYPTTNAFTGKVLETFPSMTDAELEAALAGADARFGTWRHVRFAERAAIYRKAAAILRARVDDFARSASLVLLASAPSWSTNWRTHSATSSRRRLLP
jgi:succinate-semialdehyde dehydrogenase / glutarate-semialdehyde dehydrogenase